ncbi:MAG TPA: Ig-like domain-containing protein [Patescibacteria group bacterium]|nr:Ig-like domain-containing protein [Patescibacteria group bacterium]
MKKILLLGLILFALPAMVSASEEISLNDFTEEEYFYESTFDNLVLDFTIDTGRFDLMTALVVKNRGTASARDEIEKLVLYKDDGDGVFEGFGQDQKVAEAEYDYSSTAWPFYGFSQGVSTYGDRFFVTVETKRNGTNNKSFEFALTGFDDVNDNGEYDSGDFGLFLESGRQMPAGEMLNNGSSAYKTLIIDNLAPVVTLDNLKDGDELAQGGFTIIGQAKDQGGSVPSLVEICFNQVCHEVSATSSNYRTWEYEWDGGDEYEYQVYLKVEDFNGNSYTSEPISITKQIISSEKSTVEFNKTTALADGQDAIQGIVTICDAEGNPLPDKVVYWNEVVSDYLSIIGAEKATNSRGQAIFNIKSDEPGVFKTNITAGDGVVIKEDITLTFEEPSPEEQYEECWIKQENDSAVSYVNINGVRHLYPSLSVWQSYYGDDFSRVETVDSSVIYSYSLGQNVQIKPGSLLKLKTVAKVYQVLDDATLRWIKTEEKAEQLYGEDWNQDIYTLPEIFFSNYTLGEPLE